ncbi:MAG: hypothetical protein PQJ58_13825 [Spirochaetales bacterium]|nr:hypothetical protein [Spirochaetales bacterium]
MTKITQTALTMTLYTVFLLTLVSCSNLFSSSENQPFQHDPVSEEFDDAEMPVYTTESYNDNGTLRTYELMLPWNYNKDYNAERYYPLMINVHYSGSLVAGNTERMKDYPCFCLNAAQISDWTYSMIAELVNSYRIDINRIYLSGFSAGGSGSYPFASNLEAAQGLTAAGIVRCAGGSNTALSDSIAGKTSVWYHVGLSDSYDFGYGNGLLSEDPDDDRRISNQAYAYVKNLTSSKGAYEYVKTVTVSGYERTTTSLNMAGVDIFKKSHYAGMGHTGSPAYNDPEVVQWLFNQHLSNRK